MKKELFGHRKRRHGRDRDDEEEARDNPPNYEGREHVRVKEPGYSKHHIRTPEDEPKMRSRVSKEESHEMEDNYHMKTPDWTEDTLPAKIKRARMKMDAPDQQDPKPLRGNIVHNVPYRGEEDEDGLEEYGPNYMQEDEDDDMRDDKEDRKKMVVTVMKKKMKKQGYDSRLDESMGARDGKKSQSYKDRRDESEGEERHKRRPKFSGNRRSHQ